MPNRKWLVWGGVAAVVLLAGWSGWRWYSSAKDQSAARRQRETAAAIRVITVKPNRTQLERATTEQGTIQATDTVELFAEVSGKLQTQTVDIGDIVTEGQVVARLHVPEIEQEFARARANAVKARARLLQAQKNVGRSEADLRVAQEGVPAAESALENARASRRYRDKQLERTRALRRQNAVEARLVDENEERRDAAAANEKAVASALNVARAQIDAAQSKLELARADVEEADAEVLVADAEAERAKVRMEFATLRSPFPAIVTKRYLSPGAFVRAASQGEKVPVLALDRLDRVRVVIQIPDRLARFADRGDPATVEVDSLGGKTFEGKISRTQGAEDTATRTMRVEIDLPNPNGELRPGTFAKVSLRLQKVADALVLPSGCLVGEARAGQGNVFVVRDGKAVLTPVRIGVDNGVSMEVLSGVGADDLVVRRFSGTLTDGATVRAEQE